MRAGRLRHRITVFRQQSARDAVGAPVNARIDVCTAWAHVSIATGRERWASEHVVNDYDVVVTMRYNNLITEGMMIDYHGRILNIASIVDPYQKKSELKLLCRYVKN